MKWEITSHEFELNEGEVEHFLIGDRERPLPVDGEADHPALVLVEALTGQPEAFHAFVSSDDPEFASGGTGWAKVFVGKVKKGASLAVTLTAHFAGRFRVSVLRLRERLKQSWNDFPCDTCKSIAKILARSILGWLGVGMPGTGEALDALSEFDIGKLFEELKNSPLWKWITDSGLEVLAVAMLGGLMLLIRQGLATEDWLYAEACRGVGACKGG